MPLTEAQLRRMEADYMDLDKRQKLTLVGNAIRVMPREMFRTEMMAQLATGNGWRTEQFLLGGIEQGERLAEEIANRGGYHYENQANPITATMCARMLATALDPYGPIASQFYENLYEQTTGPLDVDPPPRPVPHEIRVRRSEIGWSDAIGTDTINTGDRVIRLGGDNRAVFLAAPLLQWFANHPDNPTNPLNRDPAPPNVREPGVAVVEEDDGPPPPGGGRRRRRRVTRSTRDLGSRKGRKARKSTRRR